MTLPDPSRASSGMSTTVEQAYYENPAHWQAERYLLQEPEVRRLRACAAAVPADARSLLDVGAGNGAFLQVVEEMRPGLRAEGVERALTAIEMSVCRAPMHAGSIEALPFADRSWDVVASLEVLEHVPHGLYGQALAELERVADRYLLIEVPYREDRVLVQCPYCSCAFNPHYHMRRYDDADMRGLFRAFRCVGLRMITTRDVLFGGAVKKAFRALRRRAGFFPAHALCPQCGYHAEGAAAQTAAAGTNVRGRTQLAMRVGQAGRRLLSLRSRPLAVIGIYERIAP